MNPLLELKKAGQSVWLDFITRKFIAEGKLDKLVREDGLTGVTSNPTIFQKAVVGSPDYDAQIRAGIDQGQDAAAIFEALAVQDIQKACDVFQTVYKETQGADGYVSIEVEPHMARDTQGTTTDARRLWKSVNRPNVMVKIPATKEGLPAIEQCLSEGININITLIFSNQRYQEVIEAWLTGLERLSAAGKPLHSVASVASFFVSRVDSLVDSQLEKNGKKNLMGKAAIANAQEAYRIFESTISHPRFKALAAKGARVQRPLWASTSTKNPAYRDVLYVEELVGHDTVNTLPLATIDAFRDHGNVRKALPAAPQHIQETFSALQAAGIDINAVTRQLEEEGIVSFQKSYDDLLQSINQKRESLAAR
jgi:transaldolase